MVTEAEFSNTIQKLPDYMIERLVDYINVGHKFIYRSLGSGKGEGCVLGIAGQVCDDYYWKQTPKILNLRTELYSKHKWEPRSSVIITEFNDENYNKPILYQLILAEAERRGMKPKLEMEKVIA